VGLLFFLLRRNFGELKITFFEEQVWWCPKREVSSEKGNQKGKVVPKKGDETVKRESER
jgi:hypothetical protein